MNRRVLGRNVLDLAPHGGAAARTPAPERGVGRRRPRLGRCGSALHPYGHSASATSSRCSAPRAITCRRSTAAAGVPTAPCSRSPATSRPSARSPSRRSGSAGGRARRPAIARSPRPRRRRASVSWTPRALERSAPRVGRRWPRVRGRRGVAARRLGPRAGRASAARFVSLQTLRDAKPLSVAFGAPTDWCPRSRDACVTRCARTPRIRRRAPRSTRYAARPCLSFPLPLETLGAYASQWQAFEFAGQGRTRSPKQYARLAAGVDLTPALRRSRRPEAVLVAGRRRARRKLQPLAP